MNLYYKDSDNKTKLAIATDVDNHVEAIAGIEAALVEAKVVRKPKSPVLAVIK